MGTSQKKGDALERAVHRIESTIVAAFPGVAESTFTIEGKKKITVGEVRHEIDLYVSTHLGQGYDSVFIFECRNRQEKVDKNDIIVFAAKINAARAQRGFFIAKSYTRDAEKQALSDRRVELLLADQLDPSALMVPSSFHAVTVGTPSCELIITLEGVSASSEPITVPLESATLTINGASADLEEYTSKRLADIREQHLKDFGSDTANEGNHRVQFEDRREFQPGQVVVNGSTVVRMDVAGGFDIYVSRGVIVSAFDVPTRGRVISVEVDTPSGARMLADFVRLSDGSDELVYRIDSEVTDPLKEHHVQLTDEGISDGARIRIVKK